MTMRIPAEVFPPGEFVRDELEERGWTQTDLADILGTSARLVNEVIAGKRGISTETAKGLAAAFDTSPELWMNLDAAHRLWRDGAYGDEPVRRRSRLYSLVPVKDLIRRGWIGAPSDLDELERAVLGFLEMDTLDATPACFAHAARTASPSDSMTPGQLAWLCRTRQLAREISVLTPYSERSLVAALQQLRGALAHPDLIGDVPRILNASGIRLVIVEPLPGTRIDGACFWIDDGPVVALSLRFDRIDYFWLTLIHELGHVSQRSLAVDVDFEKTTAFDEKPASERTSDRFVSEQLISPHRLDEFIARTRPHYSTRAVSSFASAMEVHPGIVVGQLRHRREITWAAHRRLLVPVRECLVGRGVTDGWQ